MKNQKKNQWRKFSNEIKILLEVFKQKKIIERKLSKIIP